MRNLILLAFMSGCTYNYYTYSASDTDATGVANDTDYDDTDPGEDSDALTNDTDLAQYGEAVLLVDFLGPTAQGSPPFVEPGELVWMGGTGFTAYGGRVLVMGLTLHNETKNSWLDWTPMQYNDAMPPYFTTCLLIDDATNEPIAEAVPTQEGLSFQFNLVVESREYRTMRTFCNVQSPWLWGGRRSAAFYFWEWDAVTANVQFVLRTTNGPMENVHFVKLPSLDYEPGDDTGVVDDTGDTDPIVR